MSDMLVKLYAIDYRFGDTLADAGVAVKRASIIDKDKILGFVRDAFPDEKGWVNECEYALFNNPISCLIAVRQKEIVGFACCDATAKGFFGPMGVREDCRGLGIGRELLLRSLYSMKEAGYAYAIIGWPSKMAVGLYEKHAGAAMIEDSPPHKSVYRNMVEGEP